jgi:hypothetical protein
VSTTTRADATLRIHVYASATHTAFTHSVAFPSWRMIGTNGGSNSQIAIREECLNVADSLRSRELKARCSTD